jgi:hypothetical protein
VDIDGKRARWIEKMIEFNIEVKPTKMVKGQGLAKLLAEENHKLLDINFIAETSGNSQIDSVAEGHHDSQQVEEHLSPVNGMLASYIFCKSLRFLLNSV